MPEGYNGDPGLPPTPTGPRNLPEEEAAALAAHRLAVRERELSAVAPCACGVSPEDGLKDMIDIIERNGIGPLLRGIILKRMENADLVVLRRVR